jgi:hypothetical protein
MKKYLFVGLVAISFLMNGCTANVYLNVLRPADVSIRKHIQSVALVNRAKPKSKVANVIEAVLTGEDLFQDKSGKEKALTGIYNMMYNSPRFSVLMTDLYLEGSGAGSVFPDPLSWQQVEKYCADYKTDALLALETFDSDNSVTTNTRTVDKKDAEGKVIKVVEHVAELRVRVMLGFRLYDPKDKGIADEYHFTEVRTWKSTGTTPDLAIRGLISRRAASDEASLSAGTKYGYRICPTWVRVRRNIYKKGKNKDIKYGYKLASAKKWEEADKVWRDVASYEKKKTAGRAAYNVAISQEVLGNLYDAQEWATYAYTEFGNKEARSYINIINRRIADNERAQKQMQQEEE